MSNVNKDWERLSKVIEWSGMTTNSFARHLGMSRSETLYQIKKGNNCISRAVSEAIVAKFPRVSKAWLLTGYGGMLDGDKESLLRIPCYDVELPLLFTPQGCKEVASYIFLPQMDMADMAAVYRGDDLKPAFSEGTVLFLKKIAPESVIFGAEHVVVCQKFVTLRNVYPADDAGCVRLRLADSDGDERTVAWEDVREIYAVCGKLITNL